MTSVNDINKSVTEAKWDRIYKEDSSAVVADVLLENDFLLPEKGDALDLACGLGANAIFLAEKGLTSYAWDISSVALDKLSQSAQKKDLIIATKQLCIDSNSLSKNTFDVIVLSHFLDRSLCNAIMDALKPDGLLFYQTYTREKLGNAGPKSSDFLLARNELLQLFSPLNILVYRENSRVGDLNCGERNLALLVAQKC